MYLIVAQDQREVTMHFARGTCQSRQALSMGNTIEIGCLRNDELNLQALRDVLPA